MYRKNYKKMYKVNKTTCSEVENCTSVRNVNGQTVCRGCGIVVVKKENEVNC